MSLESARAADAPFEQLSSGEVQEGARMLGSSSQPMFPLRCYADTLELKLRHRSYSSTGPERLGLGLLIVGLAGLFDAVW